MKPVTLVSGPKSNGARLLAAALTELGVDVTRSQTKKEGRLNIGWGKPGDVNKHLPANKLHELEVCKKAGVRTVPFGTLENLMVSSPSGIYLGRAIKHTEGKDIVLIKDGKVVYKGKKAGVPDFYTSYVPKAAEYRVHVWFGKAIRYGKKMYKGDGEPKSLIWNLANNFKFDYGEAVPKGAWDLAKGAVTALGLDFGAVDVIEGTDGKFYFLEVNTRPGIEGRSITKYAEKIKLLAEAA